MENRETNIMFVDEMYCVGRSLGREKEGEGKKKKSKKKKSSGRKKQK